MNNAKTEGLQTGSPSEIELSFSRLQSYMRCPILYRLVYEEGWRAAPTAPMALGLSLHRALAAYLSPENQNRSIDALLETYDRFWVNEGFSSAQETLDTYDTGRKMLERFFEVQRGRSANVVATEKDFMVRFEGIAFRGTVDRLDRLADGEYEVIEYKTQADHWHDARRETDLQMTLYEFGVAASLNLPSVRLSYFFLSTGEFVSTRRTDIQIEEAKKLLRETADRIRAKEFQPNPAYCPRCDFASRCPSAKR